MSEELKPCPFCGAGETRISEARQWTGMAYSEPISVSVRHWCTPVDGQPSRMIERIGRDHASAVAAWNRRTVSGQEAYADWELIRVKNLAELVDALDRADRKGYMPDAIADSWEAFQYITVDAAPIPATELSDEKLFKCLKKADPEAKRLPPGFKAFARAIIEAQKGV